MNRRSATHAQFADKLVAIGVRETEHNTRDKIDRGGLTAVFLL